MQHGVWQRWRMLYSGIKGFFVLSIWDAQTNLPAPLACEMMLYAKVGVCAGWGCNVLVTVASSAGSLCCFQRLWLVR